MNALTIEINDAELTVADSSGVLAVEPGYVTVDRGELVIGDAAYSQARLRPRQTSSRYWENLSLESGSAGVEGLGSSAELAFRQLEALWVRLGGFGRDVVLIVPGHYTQEQLGLLLGIFQECKVPVRAMVNAAAAAACAHPCPGRHLVHLDVHLHRFSATRLQQADGVSADPEEALNGVGLVSLMDLWARRVAETFIVQTRFDPFHRADSEQVVYDRLPESLAALSDEEEIALGLTSDGKERVIRLNRKHLLGASAGAWRAVVQFVAQQREAGTSLTLLITHRVSRLLGLSSEFTRLDDARIVTLSRDAATAGALASVSELDAGSGPVKLLKRLPWRSASGHAAPVPLVETDCAQEPTPGTEVRATHLVHKGVALRVGKTALHIGRGDIDGRRTILVDGRHQAVSRSHCEVVRRDGELRLKDNSRFGTFVNEKRVRGETVLLPADVIRVGSPGEELQVIAVEARDGP